MALLGFIFASRYCLDGPTLAVVRRDRSPCRDAGSERDAAADDLEAIGMDPRLMFESPDRLAERHAAF